MAKYAFFLGCIAPLRYPGIEKSTRVVAEALGIELVDLTNASCCPAPGVIRAFDKKTWIAAAARNLALAEKNGLDILTICNGCYGSLFDAAHELSENKDLLADVNEILSKIGLEYKGTTKVRHFAEVLYNDIGIEAIRSKIVKPLEYEVAAFYGCHFLKPSKIKQLDDPENPHILDELISVTGAKSMPRKQKVLCCGAGGGLRAGFPNNAMKLTETNLENIKESGAKYIIDVCPFCHLQFDIGQKDLGYTFPVLHLSQLYGIAMGMDVKELGLSAHQTPVTL
ncbi:MAG: CoB--CoM heterodisulfide reductase subunit B [archaeon]|nr:CoB--CoM heterodisulfide reductase subunit B [archaeon]